MCVGHFRLERSTRTLQTLFAKFMASQDSKRIQFPAAEVLAVQRRTGVAGWLRPGFNIFFRCGVKLYITNEEKEELDQAIEKHTQMAAVMGIIANAQGNRPRG